MRNEGEPVAAVTAKTPALAQQVEESFRNDCRHAVAYHVKTGVKADGHLMAQDIDPISDKGTYAHGNGMNVPR
jgi:CO/xanthine dehydrogenase Mo-binding subunit